MARVMRSVKFSTAEIYDKAKQLARRVIQLMENVWFKRIAVTFLLGYSVYYVTSQYQGLKDALSNLTPNLPLLFFSSAVLLVSVLFSVNSWRLLIVAFGYTFPWIDIAHAQMLSMLGKYIPGHIWNYSSKIYLSYKLGFPFKRSGLAVIIEMFITYLVAMFLFLVFIPKAIFSMGSSGFLIIRLTGSAGLILLLLIPFLLSKFLMEKALITAPHRLVIVILIRAGLWILSSYAFLMLIQSLGFPQIGLSSAISVITSSFFVGFLAIFVPDGLVIREAIIIMLLRALITTPDATLISLVFRFQLIIVEFLSVLIIMIIWKIRNNQMKTTQHQ